MMAALKCALLLTLGLSFFAVYAVIDVALSYFGQPADTAVYVFFGYVLITSIALGLVAVSVRRR